MNTRELWFVCVNNPDGYEYTFTPGNRLWRKNMADNNGNGVRGEAGRRRRPQPQPRHALGLRQRGLLGRPSCRRPTAAPARTPSPRPRRSRSSGTWSTSRSRRTTTRRPSCCCGRNGFQQYTPTPDDKLFEAYAGDDADPAIADKVFNAATASGTSPGNRFDPDIGAELYITNGDLTDDAYDRGHPRLHARGLAARTSRTSRASSSRTSRPTSRQEFQRHKLFALDLARSADDPANPISHLGNTVENFYVETFADSYGDPQAVQVVAKKSLGDVSCATGSTTAR